MKGRNQVLVNQALDGHSWGDLSAVLVNDNVTDHSGLYVPHS